MKTLYIVLSLFIISLLSSFKTSDACEYAGSNIGYVKTQTQIALADNDLNKAKFLTYKALKGIYSLNEQLGECGCELAVAHIGESEFHLKKAVKANSLLSAKSLLTEAYIKINMGLQAIERHHLHERNLNGEDLGMNRLENSERIDLPALQLDRDVLHVMIDDSLIPFEESLQRVVDSVDCKDARAFTERIFKICEQELLNPGLSEGKKYYNLRTKEITEDALQKLSDCGNE